VRIRRVAGRQASRPLLIGLKVRRTLKRTSGLDKLLSIVHRMSMELESKFLDSLPLHQFNTITPEEKILLDISRGND